MNIKVADYISNKLSMYGVDYIFLLSGGGMMHLLDGIARNPQLNLIYHHHEQCAGIAAEAYSRVKSDIGVCFATSGPGALNIVMPIAGAWYDSVPILFVTGQSKKNQTIHNSRIKGLRQFGTFEADICEIVKPITKFTWFLDNPNDIPYVLDKAIFEAKSGRPGPVLIDIPVDIQGSFIDFEKVRSFIPVDQKIKPSDDSINTIIDNWKKSKRPVILAGHGVRVGNVIDEIIRLSKLTFTPVITTQLGKDIINYDDESFIGHPGIKGDRAGNLAVQFADFILCIGSSLHTLTTGYEIDKFAPNAFITRVDLERSLFEREEVKVSHHCFADVQSFMSTILCKIENSTFKDKKESKWNKWLLKNKNTFDIMNEPHKKETGKINIYKVIDIINKESSGNEVVVNDAGSAFYSIGHAWKVKGKQRIITSGGLGAMGWALPAATGASKVNEASTVLCFTGDGSLYTNVHELAVISKQHCNVKIIIFNNDGYLSIKNTQDNYFNSLYAGVDENSGVFIPSIKKLSEVFELSYYCFNSESDLQNEISEILKTKEPCIIEIFTNKNQEIIPTVNSKKLEDGSMESMPLQNMSPFIDEVLFGELIRDLI